MSLDRCPARSTEIRRIGVCFVFCSLDSSMAVFGHCCLCSSDLLRRGECGPDQFGVRDRDGEPQLDAAGLRHFGAAPDLQQHERAVHQQHREFRLQRRCVESASHAVRQRLPRSASTHKFRTRPPTTTCWRRPRAPTRIFIPRSPTIFGRKPARTSAWPTTTRPMAPAATTRTRRLT